MKVSKNDLKEVLRPLVKECVEELMNQNILSNIVKEVASGVVQGMSVLTETRQQPQRIVEYSAPTPGVRTPINKLENGRKSLIKSLGQELYTNIYDDVDTTRNVGIPDEPMLTENMNPLTSDENKAAMLSNPGVPEDIIFAFMNRN